MNCGRRCEIVQSVVVAAAVGVAEVHSDNHCNCFLHNFHVDSCCARLDRLADNHHDPDDHVRDAAGVDGGDPAALMSWQTVSALASRRQLAGPYS